MPQLSLHSPVGDLTISEEEGCLVALDWGWVQQQSDSPGLLAARRQLQQFFDGARAEFGFALAPRGTVYQRKVWEALRAIPYGATRTYRQLAHEVGGSARSIGNANGRNPLPIIIPCHRVVGTTGLGGYSGEGGLVTKSWLLALEARSAASRAA